MNQELIQRPRFEIDQAFQFLNNEGHAKVSQQDLQQVLRLHGIIAFEKQANCLFTRYDKDKDGLIDLRDFKSELSTLEKKKSRK